MVLSARAPACSGLGHAATALAALPRPPPAALLHSTLALRGGGGVGASPAGLAAAICGPAASALGILVWEGAWRGSAFALNLVKVTHTT